MDWVLVVGAAWLLIAAAVAVLIAAAVRLADRRAERGRAKAARRDEKNFVVQPPPAEPAGTAGRDAAAPTPDQPQVALDSRPTPTPVQPQAALDSRPTPTRRVPPTSSSATLPTPPA
jgi:hypothetical protein